MRVRALILSLALLALLPAAGAGAADGTPPVVSITTPTTLTGSLLFAFSEDVQNVTSDNVLIRYEGATSGLASTLRCRSGAGADVSCATGPVRTVTLTPAAILIPGQVYGGVVNVTGPAPVTDISGEPAALTQRLFRTSVIEEETSAAASFRWRIRTDAGAYGGSYAIERLNGAYARYSFTGSSITWHSLRGPDQGKATVFIDGVSKGTFDQYASTRVYRTGRTFAGLGAGRHSFSLRVDGRRRAASTNTYIVVDALTVGGVRTSSPAMRFQWRRGSATPAYGDRYAVSDIAGANVYFTFRGPGIDWFTAVGPDQGIAEVYVDGVLKRTYDNYAPATKFGVVRSLRNMSDKIHTLRIIVKGKRASASRGTNVIVDRFVVRLISVAAFRHLGAWVDLYDYALDPHTAIANMRSHGVKTVYLQTARWSSSADIVYPTDVNDWLREAHTAGLKVVGWYLPAYSEYMNIDVRRTVAIARYRSPEGHHFDALGIDIEYKGKTASLSEFNAGIVTHLDRVRSGAGSSFTIAAIVPSPIGMAVSPSSWTGFPWSAIGTRAHVVLPMAYWSYRTDCPSNPAHCPYRYGLDNVTESRRLTGLPVHIIGGVGDNVTAGEVRDFVAGTRAAKAYGGSLYDYRTTASSYWPYLEKLNLDS